MWQAFTVQPVLGRVLKVCEAIISPLLWWHGLCVLLCHVTIHTRIKHNRCRFRRFKFMVLWPWGQVWKEGNTVSQHKHNTVYCYIPTHRNKLTISVSKPMYQWVNLINKCVKKLSRLWQAVFSSCINSDNNHVFKLHHKLSKSCHKLYSAERQTHLSMCKAKGGNS